MNDQQYEKWKEDSVRKSLPAFYDYMLASGLANKPLSQMTEKEVVEFFSKFVSAFYQNCEAPF